MVHIKEYLKSHGLCAKDIPKGFVLFNTLGVLTYITSISLCYRYRPLHNLFQHPKAKELLLQIQQRNPQLYNQSVTIIDKQSSILANSKLVTSIAHKFHLDPKKLTMAFAENFIVYKATLPITIPLNLWLTIHLISKKHLLQDNCSS